MPKIIQSNKCSVCLEQYTDESYPTMLPCGHIICSQCISRLTVCPIDRQIFDKDETTRVFNAAEEKTEIEKVADFAESVTEKIRKIQELEEMIEKLVTDKTKLLKWYEKNKKSNEKLKAENEMMKAKLTMYEKIWLNVADAYLEGERAILNSKFVIEISQIKHEI